MRGISVSIEGADCCGKTTIINRLSEQLANKGHEVIICRGIGEGERGLAIRNILLNFEPNNRMNPVSEFLLFIAAIRDCYEHHIKPGVDAGKIVIVDRYIQSTFIYQTIRYIKAIESGEFKDDVASLANIGKLMINMPILDLSVIVNVTKATMTENFKSRGKGNSMDNFCFQNATQILKDYKNLPFSRLGHHNYLSISNNRPYPKPDNFLDPIIKKIESLLVQQPTLI